MMWIHGGKYLEGGSGNPHSDGATLAQSGVVVVSVNYRVGVEGFAHIAGAPDNRGILDQVAALRWVQDNIAAFGGDPGRVIVFGQSAGAGCIAALLAMPMAAGLFRRAIAQSAPGTYFSPRLAAAISATIAAELGARATVDELARLPPRALTDATDAVIQKMPEFVDSWGPMALTPTPFSPVVDGVLLPDAPWRALAGGAARDIDLLAGHTRNEYSLFTARPGSEVTDEQVSATLQRLAPAANGRVGYRDAYPEATPGELDELVNSDWLFRMPSLHLAHAQHAGAEPPGPTNSAGATTASTAPRTASTSCSCSARSASTMCTAIPLLSRTPRTRSCASPTTCAPTGRVSRPPETRAGRPTIRPRAPPASTTLTRLPSPIPRNARAESGVHTGSTPWTW